MQDKQLTRKGFYDPDPIRKAFRFLVDEFNYVVTRDEEAAFSNGRHYAFVIHFVGNDRRINVDYEYIDNAFYCDLIRGRETLFPNDLDQENIRSFWALFKRFEPQRDWRTLQPIGQTYAEAAEVNAQLLRKYCSAILRGEEWI